MNVLKVLISFFGISYAQLILGVHPPAQTIYRMTQQPDCERYFNQIRSAKMDWKAQEILTKAKGSLESADASLLEILFNQRLSKDSDLDVANQQENRIDRLTRRFWHIPRAKKALQRTHELVERMHRSFLNGSLSVLLHQSATFQILFQKNDFYPEVLDESLRDGEIAFVQEKRSQIEAKWDNLDTHQKGMASHYLEILGDYQNAVRQGALLQSIKLRIQQEEPVYLYLLERLQKLTTDIHHTLFMKPHDLFSSTNMASAFGEFRSIVTENYFLQATLANPQTFFLFEKMINFIEQAVVHFRLVGNQSLALDAMQTLDQINRFFEINLFKGFDVQHMGGQLPETVKRDLQNLIDRISHFKDWMDEGKNVFRVWEENSAAILNQLPPNIRRSVVARLEKVESIDRPNTSEEYVRSLVDWYEYSGYQSK